MTGSSFERTVRNRIENLLMVSFISRMTLCRPTPKILSIHRARGIPRYIVLLGVTRKVPYSLDGLHLLCSHCHEQDIPSRIAECAHQMDHLPTHEARPDPSSTESTLRSFSYPESMCKLCVEGHRERLARPVWYLSVLTRERCVPCISTTVFSMISGSRRALDRIPKTRGRMRFSFSSRSDRRSACEARGKF